MGINGVKLICSVRHEGRKLSQQLTRIDTSRTRGTINFRRAAAKRRKLTSRQYICVTAREERDFLM